MPGAVIGLIVGFPAFAIFQVGIPMAVTGALIGGVSGLVMRWLSGSPRYRNHR